MAIEITSFVVGVLTGTIVTLAMAIPRVGVATARVVGVSATAIGFGLLIWAFDAQASGGTSATIILGRVQIADPGDAFGWGAGLLLGGAITVLLSFLRERSQGDRHSAMRRA
jgi:hypothetical protein